MVSAAPVGFDPAAVKFVNVAGPEISKDTLSSAVDANVSDVVKTTTALR